MEDLIEIGFDRILTSGQEKDAFHGAQLISKLIDMSHGRIIIMPGCGINSGNLPEIKSITKAIEFHASAKKFIQSEMQFINNISMGKDEINEHHLLSADYNEILRLKEILDEL